MAAVHGGGYCSSAGLAVRTIMGNALRVAAVDMVGDALVFLGKLSVMAGSGEPRNASIIFPGLHPLQGPHCQPRYAGCADVQQM